MRCPDCNKFTSLETNEPNVNEEEVTVDTNGVRVQYSVEMERACADCSTVMKSFSGDCETEVPWDSFDGWKDLPEAAQKAITEGVIEPEVETSEDSEVNESGGGRYAKNMITTTVTTTLIACFTFKKSEYKLNATAESTCEAAASEFEEQV